MHKYFILPVALLITSTTAILSQELIGITSLSANLSECSGLHMIDGSLLSIEDSGNDNAVFEIDTVTGEIVREVIIGNTENIDWESITADESFLYIGDFGNNNGSRQDLRIFRVPLDEYLDSDITQSVEVISFNYADQTDFTSNPLATNFDAEAFCSYGDSLILFSKNWLNGYSKVYKIPKAPGNHQITVTDSINAQGFVTGCDCNSDLEVIHLIGHNALLQPFVVRLSNFSPEWITDGLIDRDGLSTDLGQSSQIEGVTSSYSSKLFVSSEQFFNTSAWLFDLNWDIDLSIENPQKLELEGFVSPNPSNGSFRVDFEGFTELQVIDHSGKVVYKAEKLDRYQLNVDHGLYQVVLKNRMNHKIASQRLVIINP